MAKQRSRQRLVPALITPSTTDGLEAAAAAAAGDAAPRTDSFSN